MVEAAEEEGVAAWGALAGRHPVSSECLSSNKRDSHLLLTGKHHAFMYKTKLQLKCGDSDTELLSRLFVSPV